MKAVSKKVNALCNQLHYHVSTSKMRRKRISFTQSEMATDMIYKTDEIHRGKSRIAFRELAAGQSFLQVHTFSPHMI